VLLLTTLDAWRADPDLPFRSETAAYTPEEDAVALANDAFGDEQVIALVVPFSRMPLPGAINRSTVEEVRYARRDPSGRATGFFSRPPVAESLDLLPHPEGGWFRETWRTATPVQAHGGERASATGIYFLLGADEESMWHAVRSDELWLWHRGGPLELTTRDAPGEERTVILGPDVERGQVPQALVPGGVWQSARPSADQEVLVSCVVSPGFDPADFSV
jgi:predicted cupin superfamily sugar epimerase